MMAPRMPSTDPEAPTLLPESLPEAGDAGDLAGAETVGPDGGDTRPIVRRRPRALPRGDALGRYIVVDVLGRGGMGVVYSAYDPELDRKVAIKLLRWQSDTPRGTSGRSRLVREAQAMAKLSHRNVVTVHDVGELDDSVFVAMEFIDGQTLAAWIDATSDPPKPWREVLDVFLEAGRGLEAAHLAGLVHRDFKPENVMVARDGRVVVLDFGLARPSSSMEADDGVMSRSGDASSSALHARLTVTGSLMGTPAFMSPEQFAGGATDARTDQFSFCVALFRAVYGHAPFAGDTIAELSSSVLGAEVVAPPRTTSVPGWVRRALLKGISRAPDDRFPSMTALLDALSRDSARRTRRLVIGVGAVALIVGGVAAGRYLAAGTDPCALAGAAIDEAWGPDRRAAAESAFAHDAKAFSSDTWRRVSSRLDTFATQWRAHRIEACRGAQAVGTPEGAVATQRAQCLDARLRRVDAITRLFAAAEQTTVARAVDLLVEVAPPDECEDPTVYRRIAPVPDDPELQREVEAVRRQLEHAFAVAGSGDIEGGADLAGAALAQARQLGYGPLETEAMALYSHGLMVTGLSDAAYEMMTETVTRAIVEGRDELLMAVLRDAAVMNANLRNRSDLARWQLHEARAVTLRMGGNPVTLADLDIATAITLRGDDADGGLDRALELAKSAIAVFEEHGEEMRVQEALGNLAAIELLRGEYAEARVTLERASKAANERYGPSHPQRAVILGQLAQVYAHEGAHEEAIAALREAHRVTVGALGAGHINTMAFANGLGLELSAIGRSADALEFAREAYDLGRRIFKEPHRQLDTVRNNYASALRRAGRAEEAVVLVEASVQDATLRDGPTRESTLDARDLLGDALRGAGRFEEARTVYEAVIADRRTVAADETTAGLAYPMAGLALTLHALGRTDEALVMAQQGVDRLDDGTGETSRIARYALAYLLRASGETERVAELTAQLAEAFESEADGDPLRVSFRRWRSGEDVLPDY
jgi:tetratricopeptide (TPR) repeat protein/predicted Ser/Thr protein kinase